MRHIRILGLHMENMLQYRSRSLVWFIVSMLNPLIMLLFWRGALKSNNVGITLPAITSYYFLLSIATSLLTSHAEEGIAWFDIQEGKLSQYLIRPFPYFWLKLCEELPYRMLQGSYAIITCAIFFAIFGKFLQFASDPIILALTVCMFVQAFIMSHLFKMCLGFIAFWTTDTNGMFQLMEITLIVLAGYLMPFDLMPQAVARIAQMLPFSYMIYFPVTALQGRYDLGQMLNIMGIQIVWIGLFCLLYRWMWRNGLKQYTAVGQ